MVSAPARGLSGPFYLVFLLVEKSDVNIDVIFVIFNRRIFYRY